MRVSSCEETKISVQFFEEFCTEKILLILNECFQHESRMIELCRKCREIEK